MYTSTLLTVAFAALALASPQGLGRRAACEPNCDDDRGDRPNSWGRGGGGGGFGGNGFGGNGRYDLDDNDNDGSGRYNYDSSSSHGEFQSGSFGSSSSHGYGQIPLHFDGNQRDIPVDQLYNYDDTCSSIRFPHEDPCQECDGDWQRLRCTAYGDSQGRDQIGNSFDYNDGCDFGRPTRVVTLRCTYN